MTYFSFQEERLIMRIRPMLMVIITIVPVFFVIKTASSFSKSNKVNSVIISPLQSSKSQTDVPGTIDGKKDPQLIPDQVAYLMLFRTLPEPKDDNSKILAKAYSSKILGGCFKCKSGIKDRVSYEKAKKEHKQDIDTLLQVVAEFRQRVGVLDRQARAIKDRNWPTPSPLVIAQLAGMQKQKEAIVDELSISLIRQLKIEGQNGIKDFLSKTKGKIKMIPGPSGPPGTLGWQQSSISGHKH